jgi:sugar phosphate isomerase/epimerase
MNRRTFLHRSAVSGAAIALAPGSFAAAGAFPIGCYTRPWDQFEYRVALDGIAEAGFEYVGLMTAKGKSWVMIHVDSTPEEVAAVAAEVRQRRLKTISIYGGDLPVARSVQAGSEGLRRLIDHCVLCDCPNLLLGGTADEKLFAPYYRAVAECCPYAAEKRVGLSIKPHGGQNATGPQCRGIIERVGHPSFRLWYDPGNIFYYSDGRLDPVEDAGTVDGLVVGMSVKDFLPPKNVAVTPGQGRVDFPKVLARLRRGGFDRGPLVVECLAPGTAAEVTREARKTRKLIEDLLAGS